MAGLPLKGVVSFHGGLDFAKDLADTKAIQVSCSSCMEPWIHTVPPEQVSSFTIADAGNHIGKGQAYNEGADKRSFVAMKTFFAAVVN